MRLKRLDLTAYGKFTGAVLDFGEAEPGAPDLHVVYGLNEAGKSTAFSAYLDLLYGIHSQSPYAFKHPYEAMEIGAQLEFDGGTHDLVRRKLKSNSLLDRRGQPVNEALLSAALGGIGRDTYRTMFSLDDQSLKEGGKAIEQSKGDLGELLFSASAGLADVSRMLAAAREEAGHIHKKKGRTTLLAQARQQLSALKEKRAELDIQASAYAALVSAEKQAAKAYDEAAAKLAGLRAKQAATGRLLRALPLHRDLEQVERALAGFADLPRVPKDLAGLLPQLIREEARLEAQAASLSLAQDRLEASFQSLVMDEALLSLESRIAELQDLRARNRTAESDLPRRRAVLEARQTELSLLLKALDADPAADPAGLIISAERTGRIRDLIERRSGIDAALEATDREMQRIAAEEEALRQRRATLGDQQAQAPQWRRLEQAFNAASRSGLAVRIAMEQRGLPRLEKALGDALAALTGFNGDAAALRALPLPDRRRIEDWRLEAGRIARQISGHQDRLREMERLIAPLATSLALKEKQAEGLSDSVAEATRVTRDQRWAEHRNALTPETADRFETALRHDDQVTTLRLLRAGDLAELRQLSDQLTLQQAGLEQEKAQLAAARQELEALSARISRQLPPGLLPQDTPLEDGLMLLLSFLANRQDALEAADALDAARERIRTLAEEQELLLSALSSALEETGLTPVPDITRLADQAEEALHRQRLALDEAERLSRAQAELAARMTERRLDRQAAEKAQGQWQAAFEAALGETWLSPMAGPAAIRAMLDALATLPGMMRELDDLHRRIAAMEEDRSLFAETVTALCKATGRSSSPQTILQDDEALHAAFLEAKRAAERHGVLMRERDQLEKDRQALADAKNLHAAERDKLTRLFGCDGLEDLGEKFDRVAERDRLEEQRASLCRQLLAELRVSTLDEVERTLSGVDGDSLETGAAALADDIEREEARCRDLFAERARARDRLDAVGGDGLVAALEAEKATRLLEIEEMALTYLKLQTGVLAAEGALELYREKHRSAMMRRASEAFRQMTRGDYSGLSARLDKEREVLIGIASDGASKPSDTMSTGTRTQLYLALRLAGYEEFAAIRPPVPFIADDIMETFDEPRSEEVFRLFGSMAGLGQVIYFTHHRHLCDMAEATVPGVRIHTLGGGAA